MMEDTYISPAFGTPGLATTLLIGNVFVVSNFPSRGLFRTTVDAYPTEAYLVLTCQTSGSFDATPVVLTPYRVTQTAWTEAGAGWTNYTGSSPWTTAGGDYDSGNPGWTTTLSSAPAPNDRVVVDVTTLAQDAYDNRSGALELLLRVTGEYSGENRYMTFHSREATNASKRPVFDFLTACATVTLSDAEVDAVTVADALVDTVTLSDAEC
jgi:hypothetical protein